MLELKIPPLALVLLASAAMWVISIAAPSFAWRSFEGELLALIFALAGGVIALLGVVAFRQARTTVNPTKPEATSTLVSQGIYGITRNPMYLGFLLILVAVSLLIQNTLSLVVIPAFVMYMNRFQIRPEEKVLSDAFGQDFTSYTQRVRRWI